MPVAQNKIVKLVQKELNARYGANLNVDGSIKKDTMDALNRVSAIPSTWPVKRKFIGFVQYLTHLIPQIDDIPVDGYYGNVSESAFQELIEFSETGKVTKWRDEVEDEAYDGDPSLRWPTYENLEKFYGPAGSNLTKVKVPYSLRLSWNLDRYINQFTCHELVVEPIQEAMEEIYKVYGMDEIKRLNLDYFSGCYNNRKMVGSSKLSTHAFGISVDWASQFNRIRWDHTRASLARPEYEPFWEAWERTGAVSLGREKDYDWMHIQYSRF